jgi:hypothetical protein
MADRKISDLTALTTPAAGDFLPIVDISEAAAADKNKRITIEELMRGAPDGTAAAPSIAFETDPNTGIFSPSANQLAASTAGIERLRITSTGRVLVGTTTQIPTEFPSLFQTEGSQGYAADFGRFTNDSFGAYVGFVHGRGGSPGVRGIVQNGDSLGVIDFMGDDGVNLNSIGAQVLAAVDGVPGVGDMPGRLVFSTTADGLAAPTERMRITSAGNVGIGTTSPGSLLHIKGSATGTQLQIEGNASSDYTFLQVTNSSGVQTQFAANGNTDAQVRCVSNHPLTFYTNNAERARIDSSGRLLVGASSARAVEPYSNVTNGTDLQHVIEGTATTAGLVICANNTNDFVGGTVTLAKTRGTSVGSSTVVVDGDTLGTLGFAGADGTDIRTKAASIYCQVDGTPGANDMPGRLVFSVTADGSASPTEALRISSNRAITVSDGGNVVLGTTTGTKIGTATTQKLGFYNATPVVQPAAVTDATTAVDVITQLNDLLAKLRTLGIIAT